MSMNYDYTIVVRRITEDAETYFEARVREFPDLAEYADDPHEAYELAVDALETTEKWFAEHGKSLPAPAVEETEFSGRVTLRVAKSLHRILAEAATLEGVSLNQHIVNALSFGAGVLQGKKSTKATSRFLKGNEEEKGVTIIRGDVQEVRTYEGAWGESFKVTVDSPYLSN